MLNLLKKRLLLHIVYFFCPVDDPGSLFEKRDFKDRQRAAGTKSTLSMRLEQCPQQLNNPFNEYSKFDGKVNHSTFSIFQIFCRRFLVNVHECLKSSLQS